MLFGVNNACGWDAATRHADTQRAGMMAPGNQTLVYHTVHQPSQEPCNKAPPWLCAAAFPARLQLLCTAGMVTHATPMQHACLHAWPITWLVAQAQLHDHSAP